MAADIVSPAAAAAAPVSAPAIIRGPMDKHESHFTPRHLITDYRDRLYHGKPEYNHKGIQYRPPDPNKIQRLHTVALMPKQPVGDSLLRELAEEYLLRTEKKPTRCVFPGVGNRRWRGISLPGAGPVLIELVPREGDFQAFMECDEAQA